MDISALIGSAISGLVPAIVGVFLTALFEKHKIARNTPNSLGIVSTTRAKRNFWGLPIGIGLVCLLVFSTGWYFLTQPTFASSCPPLAKTTAPITSPAADGVVQQTTIVEGNACHIAEGHFLWLVVVSSTKFAGFYPQAGPIGFSSDGSWSVVAYIGDQTSHNVGYSYKLMPLVVDRVGNALFEATRAKSVNDRNVFQLPPGTQYLPDILVIRA